MIEIKNLNKQFDGVTVLKDICATFEKGKTNLVIGQSGSGKTVMLKCLIGLMEAEEGDIIFDNIPLRQMDYSQKFMLKQQIGMVFQGSALFDSMNVEENIRFSMEMFTKKHKDEIIERANQVIKRVGLLNANKKYPNEISGGMKKRVAIARAMVMNPKYLLCDEPNSGLDPKTAVLIDNLIKEVTEEYNTTTVINTHDMNSVLEIGEKIIFLFNGHKEWEGTKSEILTSDNENIDAFLAPSPYLRKIKNNFINKK